MKGAEFIRKYRYILLLAGTAIAFVWQNCAEYK